MSVSCARFGAAVIMKIAYGHQIERDDDDPTLNARCSCSTAFCKISTKQTT